MSDACNLLPVMSQWNVTDKSSYRVFLGLLCLTVFTCAASADDCPDNKYYREPWCIPCTICEDLNREVLQPCLQQSDAVCGDCFPGHYEDQRYCHSCEYAPADHRYCQLWLASQTTSRPAAGTTMSTSTQTQHSVVQTTPPSLTTLASRKPTNDMTIATSANPLILKQGPTLGPGQVTAVVLVSSLAVLTAIVALVWKIKKRSEHNNKEAIPVQATNEDQQVSSYP